MSNMSLRPQPDQVGATLSSREKEIDGSRRDFLRKFAQVAAGAGFLVYGEGHDSASVGDGRKPLVFLTFVASHQDR